MRPDERRSRARRMLFALLPLVAVAGPSARAETPEPQAVVERAADQVLAVLRDAARDDDAKRDALVRIAEAHFDFRTIARLVLARSWRGFDADQRVAFIEALKSFLSTRYGQRLGQYGREKVEIVEQRDEPRGDVTVRTRIVRPAGEPVRVDYRLRSLEDGWRVIDVVIEGISLVSSYRSQFQQLARELGPDGLIERLRSADPGIADPEASPPPPGSAQSRTEKKRGIWASDRRISSVRTPAAKVASMWSALASGGSPNERLKLP